MAINVGNPGVKSLNDYRYRYIISKSINCDKRSCRKRRFESKISDETHITHEADNVYNNLNEMFKQIKIGDYIKCNSRILILDSDVSLFAFIRSIYIYGVESVLLFDHKSNDILGQINKCDILLFLMILNQNRSEPNDDISPWKITLSNWIEIKKPDKIHKIDLNTSFLDISQLMLNESLESIYVWSSTRNYYISNISHLYILDFLVQNIKGTIPNHNKLLKDLHIGSFDDIVTLNSDTSYIQAIELLINFNIYMAPIMDYGKFYGFFSRKSAVKYLIKSFDEKAPLEFDIGLKHLIDKYELRGSKNILTVSQSIDSSVFVVDDLNISLSQAISILAKNCANKLLLVDSTTFKFGGIVTLTDIITILTH